MMRGHHSISDLLPHHLGSRTLLLGCFVMMTVGCMSVLRCWLEGLGLAAACRHFGAEVWNLDAGCAISRRVQIPHYYGIRAKRPQSIMAFGPHVLNNRISGPSGYLMQGMPHGERQLTGREAAAAGAKIFCKH